MVSGFQDVKMNQVIRTLPTNKELSGFFLANTPNCGVSRTVQFMGAVNEEFTGGA